jgi:hypothetical protein
LLSHSMLLVASVPPCMAAIHAAPTITAPAYLWNGNLAFP